tara:strand:+ start:1631 stop:1948 length:318 start_codon:yes stop_codon:yes gene_type:complete
VLSFVITIVFLIDLFEELKVKGQEDLLEVFVFVTGAATYVIDAPFPILSGRPDFNGIFRRLRNIHNKRTVGVFFCGPKVFIKLLSKFVREKENTADLCQFSRILI